MGYSRDLGLFRTFPFSLGTYEMEATGQELPQPNRRYRRQAIDSLPTRRLSFCDNSRDP